MKSKTPIFLPFEGGPEAAFLERAVQKILERIEGIPPQLSWIQHEDALLRFSIALITPNREGAARFFFEMISRWLLPGKPQHTLATLTTEFRLAESEEPLLACQVCLEVDCSESADQLVRNLFLLEREILLGASSSYQAAKILEMKNLSIDDKRSLVQERIAAVVQRFPARFDYDLFSEMQHLLITAAEAFKENRDAAHLARMVWVQYAFRRALEKKVDIGPGKRHLLLKLKRLRIQTPFGFKEGLACFIGLNFIKAHELFEERHFLSALHQLIQGVRVIPSSFFEKESREERLHVFYLEIEKEEGEAFSKEEVARLKKLLPDEVKRRIEQLVPPIFMPRNEEEVMRNVLTLSHQLKYIRDLPQAILSFDEQSDSELSFTVVLVRLLLPGALPIRELLLRSSLSGHLLFDRVKTVGTLRRRYPKEASVFRIRLPTEQFLREDFSVDLYHARQTVLHALQEVIGEIRDFNGGMISKQHENFHQLKFLLGELASREAVLLQNFFHAIFPGHLSSTLAPHLLQILFEMLVKAMDEQEETLIIAHQKEGRLFSLIKTSSLEIRQQVLREVDQLRLPFNDLLTVQLQILDSFYLGYLYLDSSEEKQGQLLERLQACLNASV